MIGLDRPLKPEWIYELLKIIKVGDKPVNYYDKFEEIAKELVGKEGKRKVRTIIFRSFIYSFQEKRNRIENNIFLEWVKIYESDYLKPLFLSKIIMDYEIAGFIINKINISYNSENFISSQIISDKLINEQGDRDIVKRSVRVFFKTLCNFGVLRQEERNKYKFVKKFTLSDEQVKDFLILYAKFFVKSNFIDINLIDKTLLFFINEIDLHSVAKKYNEVFWEYIRDGNRNILLLK